MRLLLATMFAFAVLVSASRRKISPRNDSRSRSCTENG